MPAWLGSKRVFLGFLLCPCVGLFGLFFFFFWVYAHRENSLSSPYSFFNIYFLCLFIWLCQVLVAALKIFGCGM